MAGTAGYVARAGGEQEGNLMGGAKTARPALKYLCRAKLPDAGASVIHVSLALPRAPRSRSIYQIHQLSSFREWLRRRHFQKWKLKP